MTDTEQSAAANTPPSDSWNLVRQELDRMEDWERAEVTDAMQQDPDLVYAESHPSRFLAYTNHNVRAAAVALAQYWKRRYEIFQERALLPLTLQGGAMKPEDLDFMKTGMFTLLPPDADGCTVFCFDTSRRIQHDPQIRLRCCFYYGQWIAENPLSQTKGYVALLIMSEPRYDEHTPVVMNTFMRSFPNKPKAMHIFECLPRGAPWTNRLRVKTAIGLVKWLFRDIFVIHHHEKQKDQLMKVLLEHHGIDRDGVPVCLGGQWSYFHFPGVLYDRSEEESRRSVMRE